MVMMVVVVVVMMVVVVVMVMIMMMMMMMMMRRRRILTITINLKTILFHISLPRSLVVLVTSIFVRFGRLEAFDEAPLASVETMWRGLAGTLELFNPDSQYKKRPEIINRKIYRMHTYILTYIHTYLKSIMLHKNRSS